MAGRLRDPTRINLGNSDGEKELEEGVAGLTLAGGVEGGGFSLPGVGGGVRGARSVGSGAGGRGGGGSGFVDSAGSSNSGGSEARTTVGGGSGYEAVGYGFGLYVTVRMWREFSPKTLEKAMKGAWAPLGSMRMSIVVENLFLFQFNHRPDVNKVLREGPWRLHDHPLAIVEARPGMRICREQLVEIPYWIQIFNIPPFYQTEETARGVGSLVSKKVLAVDATVRRHPGVSTSFVRVKVVLNTAERFPRGTSVWFDEEEVPLAFKFERLLKFCYVCGMVDHEMEDCEGPFPEDFDPAKPPFGDWMRGIPPRIPTWQQFGAGSSGGGSSGNPFMAQNSGSRRSFGGGGGGSFGATASPAPRIAWADRVSSPKFPPGFEPASFSMGENKEQQPPRRALIRLTKQKVGETGQEQRKKRAADQMETVPPEGGKGANPFLPTEE